MKRIRTAQEFYNEILKSFYFGIYKKDTQFITYQEAHDMYSLSQDTISRTYAMLRRDGFIHTDGTNGTIVTFDLYNPEHVEKVPLEWPKPTSEDTLPYEVAMRLHAHAIYTGLVNSNGEQLQLCKEKVRDILRCAQDGCPGQDQVFSFWMSAISSLDNELLSRITDHFISRYLYLLPSSHLTCAQRKLIGDSAHEYYYFLLDAMERCDFEEFPARFERHYYNYYQCGGLAFAKLEDGAIFKEQALYGRLLDDICIKIISGELKKGDHLPTTIHFCKAYGVSATTVNRVYGILAEMGFISRRTRIGTKLIAGPDDPVVWGNLLKITEGYKREWENAIDILLIIYSVLSRRITITPKVMLQMRDELVTQNNLFKEYAVPYFPSAVLLSPLITGLPAGILHKYYVLLLDALNKVITLCTFRVCYNEEQGKEIYQLMCDALEVLEHGDQQMFADLSERVMRQNVALLTEAYTRIQTDCTNKGRP